MGEVLKVRFYEFVFLLVVGQYVWGGGGGEEGRDVPDAVAEAGELEVGGRYCGVRVGGGEEY